MLVIKNLDKNFHIRGKENREIFDDVNIEFEDTKTIAILGESGVGKSTLLNIIAGFDLDYKGIIEYNGKDVRKIKKKWLKDNVALIFQDFNLIDHLTVYENIELVLNQYAIYGKRKKDKINDIINKLNLNNVSKTEAKLLSGGEKQRVAIARALIKNPDIILADEPTGALDEENKKIVINFLLSLKKEGKTVIIVTHSKTVAGKCDVILEIKNKKINVIKENTKKTSFELIENNKLKIKKYLPVKLAFKNFYQKKLRNLFIAGATSIGLISMLLIMGISNGVTKKLIEDANALARPDVIKAYKAIDDVDKITSNEITFNDIQEVLKIENIEKVVPKYSPNISFIVNENLEMTTYDIAPVSGVNILYHGKYNVTINREKLLLGTLPVNNNEIAISLSDAKKLLTSLKIQATDENIKNLIGKEVKAQMHINDFYNEQPEASEVQEELNFKPLVRDIKITGIFKDSYVLIDGLYATISEELLNDILVSQKKEKISTSELTIFIKDKEKAINVLNILNEKGFYAERQDEMIKSVGDIVTAVSNVLVGITAISLIVSSFMIAIIMYINLLERKKEIAILSTVGYTVFNIKAIFYVESLILGIVTVFITYLGANLLATSLTDIIKNLFEGTSIVYNNIMFIKIFIIGIGITIISVIIPLEKVLNKNITVLLKNN